MTPEEVLVLILTKFKAEKAVNLDKKQVPVYYPSYPKIVKHAKDLRVHYDMDFKPGGLLLKKAPNQEQVEFDYALDNYRPVTTPFWGRAENSVGRIWNKDNFTVKFDDIGGKFKKAEPKQYFEEELPTHKSITKYFASIASNWKLRDPNAVLTHKPSEIPLTEDKDGDMVVDQTELIRPIPVIYMAHQILEFKEESHLLVELEEKVWIKKGNGKAKEGRVFEFYDINKILRIEQTSISPKPKFDVSLFWQHDMGFLPANELEGKPESFEGIEYFKSYFSPSLPNLNEAVVNNSTLQLSIYRQAFPHKWEITDACNEPGCVKGRIFRKDKDGKEAWDTCGACNGTNKSASPTSTYKITMPSKTEDQGNVITPPFGFEFPDPAILDFLKKHIKDLIISAFEFLGINVSSEHVKGSDTALSRQIDREEFFSFLTIFSNEIFDLYAFSIKSMGMMRYGKSWKDPEIIKPVNFSIRTFNELTEEIATARESGIPELAIIKLLQEYAKVRFNADRTFSKILDLALLIDGLIAKTDAGILLGMNSGSIAKEDNVLHINFWRFMTDELEKDPKFLEKKPQAIEDILRKRAKEELASITSTVGSTDDLLGTA